MNSQMSEDIGECEMDSAKVKVQATVTGKAAKLYELINKKNKSAAITAGLLLLARNKRLREVFFIDVEAVKTILGDVGKKEEEKPKYEESGW